MTYYKNALPMIISLVFVLVFCSNAGFAQTAGETNLAQSVAKLATNLLSAKTERDQKALLEAEPNLITVELVQALRKHGETLTQRREVSQAIIALRLTRSIAERLGDEESVAFAVNLLATNYLSRAEYPQALELWEQHLLLAPVKRDRALTARTLNSISTIKRLTGDYAAALDCAQQSLRLAEEAGDKKIVSNALNNIGLIYREQSKYARALEYFERSLALSEASGDKVAISQSLNNMGVIHGSQGNQTHDCECP
jgi:tetratricopeptide (TPR) repeat protein